MGGISNTVKKITNAVTKPFKQVFSAVSKPLKSIAKGAIGAVTGNDGSDKETVVVQQPTQTQTPSASNVNVADTKPETETEVVSRRKGLLKSAKGKKSLTVSRASGGGLNV